MSLVVSSVALIKWGTRSESLCNTLVLTLLTLKIHDTYIVNNLGAELKAKAPPSIWLCYVSYLELSPMVYQDIRHILICGM